MSCEFLPIKCAHSGACEFEVFTGSGWKRACKAHRDFYESIGAWVRPRVISQSGDDPFAALAGLFVVRTSDNA
jgi:hypothetical protein